MTYQPVIPSGGNIGWTFLSRTRDAQQAAFDGSAAVVRNNEYFRETVGTIRTAEELVSDRRLLSVALGAFGLDDDIENRFFIRKVLEEGTLAEDAFANRLSDKRYSALADAFAFHLSPPNTALSDFADDIVEKYRTRQFEVAIGEQDGDLRLALGFEREIDAIVADDLTEDAAWFTVMGNPPLRRIFEQALGLPREMAKVDIDRQLEVFRDKAETRFGVSHPAEFADPDLREKLVRNFLVRAELAAFGQATTRGGAALSLLQAQAPLF